MRLFIAVNFSAEALEGIRAARERLRSLSGGRGRFAPDGNLHLTLAFLGEVEPARAAAAAEAMDCAWRRPFELRVDRAGRFGRGGDCIYWLGCAESPALAALQRRLVRELSARGFELERRRFTAHITLARRAPEGLAGFEPAEPITERVDHIELVKSELRPEGAAYTALFRSPGGEARGLQPF